MTASFKRQHGAVGRPLEELKRSSAANTAERLRVLADMALAISSASSLGDDLNEAIRCLALALAGNSGILFSVSRDGHWLESVAEWGLETRTVKGRTSRLAAMPWSQRVLGEWRPALFSARSAERGDRELVEHLGVAACFVVPILVDARPAGVAYVNFRQARSEASEEDMIFASALAAQCGLAIKKERLRLQEESLESYKDDFLSVVAHALKSPLTGLKGYSQLLVRKALKHPKYVDDLDSFEAIESQTNRILNVANKLIDLGRIQMGRVELDREPVELVRLVIAAMDQVKVNVAKHELSLETQANQVVGNWDRKTLERAVYSLLDNAIRYSPQGGKIEIRVGCHDGEAILSVRDEGLGISEEGQKQLFHKYFRSEEAAAQKLGGVGLSLYVAKAIIEAHGGRIWAESEPNKGSTFSIRLPLT